MFNHTLIIISAFPVNALRTFSNIPVLVQAAIKKSIGWLAYKQEEFISHRSGAWKSAIRVPAWLDSGEVPFLEW